MGRSLPSAISAADRLAAALEEVAGMDTSRLDRRWRQLHGAAAPVGLSFALRVRIIAYRLQARTQGDLDRETVQILDQLAQQVQRGRGGEAHAASVPIPDRRGHLPGTVLTREWGGIMHSVQVLQAGYAWNGTPYRSLSQVAQAITGTKWNGPRFFGLRASPPRPDRSGAQDRKRRS